MPSEFIRIHNRVVRLDSISYIDFLESGLAMILMPGLNQEKQMISVDVDEARRLREFLDARITPLEAESWQLPAPSLAARFQSSGRDARCAP